MFKTILAAFFSFLIYWLLCLEGRGQPLKQVFKGVRDELNEEK